MDTVEHCGLEWCLHGPPPTAGDVASVQEHVGIVFPADFLAACEVCHGGCPNPSEIRLEGWGTTNLQNLLRIIGEPGASVSWVFDQIESELPKGVVPFAAEPGGNYFCFDCRSKPESPPVVFWYH